MHAADATGQAVQTTLVEKVKQHNRIRIFERYNAIDLVRDNNQADHPCIGAYIWNRNVEKVERIFAKKNHHGNRRCIKGLSIHVKTLTLLAEMALLWHGERGVA